MSDYHHQAEFLLTRGYVTGMSIDQLADKLSQDASKPAPEGAHTRETVYSEDAIEFVKKRRDEASETQKRLIQPGERQSAALRQYDNRPPLNQNG